MTGRAHLTADELATWRALLEAHARAVAALDRQLAEAGCDLDLREYDLLVHLAEADGSGLRLRDLAERALISRSNVTRRLESLNRRGLVRRRPDPEDGRGVIATLTAEGRRALRRAAAVHLSGVKTLVFSTWDGNLDEVRRFLEQVGRGEVGSGSPPRTSSSETFPPTPCRKTVDAQYRPQRDARAPGGQPT